MRQNRWIQEPLVGEGEDVVPFPACPRLEVTYLTDPEVLAEVLPPPLTAPPEPRVHVRFTNIEENGHVHEHICTTSMQASRAKASRSSKSWVT